MCTDSVGEFLISGCFDVRLQAWNVLTGECEAVTDGRGRAAKPLVVWVRNCWADLLAGKMPSTAHATRPSEHGALDGATLDGRTDAVLARAAANDRLLSASGDGTLRKRALRN
jgi:hypothetical protein